MLLEELKQFTGTEQYYFNPLYKKMKYTDGVKYFAEKAGAYWFLDILGTEFYEPEGFHVITLTVKDNAANIIRQDDTDTPITKERFIAFTDCPEGVYKFWLIDSVLILPSEY